MKSILHYFRHVDFDSVYKGKERFDECNDFRDLVVFHTEIIRIFSQIFILRAGQIMLL